MPILPLLGLAALVLFASSCKDKKEDCRKAELGFTKQEYPAVHDLYVEMKKENKLLDCTADKGSKIDRTGFIRGMPDEILSPYEVLYSSIDSLHYDASDGLHDKRIRAGMEVLLKVKDIQSSWFVNDNCLNPIFKAHAFHRSSSETKQMVVDKLSVMIKSHNALQRRNAVSLIRILTPDPKLKHLGPELISMLLYDKDADVRYSAASALADDFFTEKYKSRIMEALKQALDDEDKQVRKNAAIALHKIDPENYDEPPSHRAWRRMPIIDPSQF